MTVRRCSAIFGSSKSPSSRPTFLARILSLKEGSKREFQTELVQPGLISRGGHLPSSGEILIAARAGETRGVRQVENLGAEFEALRLSYLEPLDQRHVQLHEPVAAQSVPSEVAIPELRR